MLATTGPVARVERTQDIGCCLNRSQMCRLWQTDGNGLSVAVALHVE